MLGTIFSPWHNNPMSYALLYPFCRWGNRGLLKFSAHKWWERGSMTLTSALQLLCSANSWEKREVGWVLSFSCFQSLSGRSCGAMPSYHPDTQLRQQDLSPKIHTVTKDSKLRAFSPPGLSLHLRWVAKFFFTCKMCLHFIFLLHAHSHISGPSLITICQ